MDPNSCTRELEKITMMKPCFFSFIFLFLLSSSFASSDSPFIVVHKKATTTRLTPGAERVYVSIDIYNQGITAAYDIIVVDDNWAPDVFDVVHGNTSKSWERLDAGDILSHSFELEAMVKGVFYSAPAVVTFRIPTKAVLQEAYSSPILPLDVLADKSPEEKLDLAKKLLAKYGPLFSAVSLIILFGYLISTPSKSSALRAGKKKR